MVHVTNLTYNLTTQRNVKFNHVEQSMKSLEKSDCHESEQSSLSLAVAANVALTSAQSSKPGMQWKRDCAGGRSRHGTVLGLSGKAPFLNQKYYC